MITPCFILIDCATVDFFLSLSSDFAATCFGSDCLATASFAELSAESLDFAAVLTAAVAEAVDAVAELPDTGVTAAETAPEPVPEMLGGPLILTVAGIMTFPVMLPPWKLTAGEWSSTLLP